MNSPSFASACASASTWEDALQSLFAELPRLPQANLGFVYISDAFSPAIEHILARLKRHTGLQEWVGATGLGVIGKGRLFENEAAISVLIGAFPLGSFRVFSGRRPLPRDFPAYAAFVHGDPLTPDMGELVEDMAHKVRGGRLAGGLASAKQQGWHLAGECLKGGLSGVAFNKEIQTVTSVSQGCSPLPETYRVTRGQEGLIEQIDGRPALDVFCEAAGPALSADLRRAISTLMIGLTEDDADRRLYSVRRILALDTQRRRLAINDNIESGQRLIFVKRDHGDAREDLERMLAEIKAACPHPPKGALYVSCATRGSLMFDAPDTEPELIRRVFGDIPLAGFLAAGEIAGERLFGYTGTLTLFL